jgi:alkylated DNA repair dioxygenase AlkB
MLGDEFQIGLRMPRITLSFGAWLELRDAWLPGPEAELLLQTLIRELVWEQRHIVLFGKPVLQPRLIAWAGELPYRYSGQTLEPRPWPKPVRVILNAVRGVAGVEFNHVLINRYRDGRDSMGYHADNEPELGPDPMVACVSLGQTRRFCVRAQLRSARESNLELSLTSGSLLIMGGSCQRHYRHALPRQGGAAVSGERVSLTFRRVLRAPEAKST